MSGSRPDSGDVDLLDRSRAALSSVRLVAVGSTNPVKLAAVEGCHGAALPWRGV